jgi:hypothetical protein
LLRNPAEPEPVLEPATGGWLNRPGRGLRLGEATMIRKLKSGQYRLYSRKVDPRTGKRRNLGTFATREQAEQHERAVQFFKHHR